MHVFSPDTEFPSAGKGDKSGINYYASYSAIIRLLKLDEGIRQQVLEHWDTEVFPNSSQDDEFSEEEVHDDPDLQAALSAFSRAASTVAVCDQDFVATPVAPRLVAPIRSPAPLSATLEGSFSSLDLTGGPEGPMTPLAQSHTASIGFSAAPTAYEEPQEPRYSPSPASPEAAALAGSPPTSQTQFDIDDFDVSVARPPTLAALVCSLIIFSLITPSLILCPTRIFLVVGADLAR